jgi:hypothetical protein
MNRITVLYADGENYTAVSDKEFQKIQAVIPREIGYIVLFLGMCQLSKNNDTDTLLCPEIIDIISAEDDQEIIAIDQELHGKFIDDGRTVLEHCEEIYASFFNPVANINKPVHHLKSMNYSNDVIKDDFFEFDKVAHVNRLSEVITTLKDKAFQKK